MFCPLYDAGIWCACLFYQSTGALAMMATLSTWLSFIWKKNYPKGNCPVQNFLLWIEDGKKILTSWTLLIFSLPNLSWGACFYLSKYLFLFTDLQWQKEPVWSERECRKEISGESGRRHREPVGQEGSGIKGKVFPLWIKYLWLCLMEQGMSRNSVGIYDDDLIFA